MRDKPKETREREMSDRKEEELNYLAEQGFAYLERFLGSAGEADWRMQPGKIIVAYLTLTDEEREKFDRIYAERERPVRIARMLRVATPEQLRRVHEMLDRPPTLKLI